MDLRCDLFPLFSIRSPLLFGDSKRNGLTNDIANP